MFFFLWMGLIYSVGTYVEMGCGNEQWFGWIQSGHYFHGCRCGWCGIQEYPDAPCMLYLPIFGWFLGQMLVNIPYMEHMGYDLCLVPEMLGKTTESNGLSEGSQQSLDMPRSVFPHILSRQTWSAPWASPRKFVIPRAASGFLFFID